MLAPVRDGRSTVNWVEQRVRSHAPEHRFIGVRAKVERLLSPKPVIQMTSWNGGFVPIVLKNPPLKSR